MNINSLETEKLCNQKQHGQHAKLHGRGDAFFEGFIFAIKINKLGTLRIFSLAFCMTALLNNSIDFGSWTLARKHIIRIPTNCTWNAVYSKNMASTQTFYLTHKPCFSVHLFYAILFYMPCQNTPFLDPFAPELLFFLILAHSVHKMWIMQEPKKVALWNKLHFEEKKMESIEHV